MRTSRMGFDFYFSQIADSVSLRADCRRRAVGAVLVDPERRIVATGYNGTRPGSPGCLEGACPRGLLTYDEVRELRDYDDPDSKGWCIATHAEMNALLHAGAVAGGCTLYVTCEPCPGCFKAINNSGVARLVFQDLKGNLTQVDLGA